MPTTRTLTRRDALLVGGVHATLALYFWMGRGVTIVHEFGAERWDWFWQNIPADLLRDRALESLWWLHAQPPLWNALGAVLIKTFPESYLHVLQGLNIALGTALVVMVLDLVARETGNRRWGLAAGLTVALHPSLFLYEAYALYTVLVAFLIVLAARALSVDRHSAGLQERSWWALVAFVGVISALILTRSLYHLLLLAGAIPLVLIIRGRPPRSVALVLVTLVLLPTAWYGKNAVQHGFFGGSSWYGMGIWRTALFLQDPKVLNRALIDGKLDPAARLVPFSPPSAYRDLGYAEDSSIPLLSRDDFHNVNIPAISAGYQRSARELILETPSRYFANVNLAYANFSAPSSGFHHLDPNRERMGVFGKLDQWILLGPLVDEIEERLEGRWFYGSLYYFLIPAVLLIYLFQVTRGVGGRSGAADRIRQDAAVIVLAGLTLYTVLIGCTMELGENVRFKFLIEPAFLALTFIVQYRLVSKTPIPEDADSPTTAP